MVVAPFEITSPVNPVQPLKASLPTTDNVAGIVRVFLKPVHPLTLQYYLEKAGFKDIEIIYTESSRPPFEIPPLKLADGENTAEFNEAMKRVSDMIFGSQDYAAVAVKKG